MRFAKSFVLSVLALVLSVLYGSAGPVGLLYGSGSVGALDNLLAQGKWTLQITNEPNQATYFAAEFSVDTNSDNRFTDEDAKYKISGMPLNAISGITFRCGPPQFVQYSVHVNARLSATLNGQPVATEKQGVIDFRSMDQRSWFMILSLDLDGKDGLEAVTGTSFEFTPISIVNPCP